MSDSELSDESITSQTKLKNQNENNEIFKHQKDSKSFIIVIIYLFFANIFGIVRYYINNDCNQSKLLEFGDMGFYTFVISIIVELANMKISKKFIKNILKSISAFIFIGLVINSILTQYDAESNETCSSLYYLLICWICAILIIFGLAIISCIVIICVSQYFQFSAKRDNQKTL